MTFSDRQPIVCPSAVPLIFLVLLLSGCGIGTQETHDATSLDSPASVHGIVHGGQQAVTGATVTLYASGYGGYGTAGAFKPLTYTITTDSSGPFGAGGFSFTKGCVIGTDAGCNGDTKDAAWNCPAITGGYDPIIYLVSVGGNSGLSTNNGVNGVDVLAAAIGPCSGISSSTSVAVNEVSTSAFTVSFGQYMYPGNGSTPGTEGISTSGTTQGATGLLNAFNVYSKDLVGVATGAAIGAATFTGSGTTSKVTVTATSELPKLDALGNILASCVNADPTTLATAGTACHTLFNAALPPILSSATAYGGTFPSPAIDTLNASLYMALNPANSGTFDTADCANVKIGTTAVTTNIACLYALQSSSAPFQVQNPYTALTAPPVDWTIGVHFTTGTSYSTSTNVCTSGYFIDTAYKSAVDAAGNIWWINDYKPTSPILTLSEMSPYGQPMTCISPFSGTANARGLAIDPSGNVWASFDLAAGTSLYELPASNQTQAGLVTWPNTYGSTPDVPYDVFSDGAGNILFTVPSNGGSILQFAAPGTNTTPFAPTPFAGPVYGSSTNYLLGLAMDTTGNLWLNSFTYIDVAEVEKNGVTSDVTSWKTGTPSGMQALYTFYTPNTPETGEVVTLSGFTATNAPADNTTCTVSSVNDTAGTSNFQCTAAFAGASAVTTARTEANAIAKDATTYSVSNISGLVGTNGAAVDLAGNYYTAATTGTSPGPLLEKWVPTAGNAATLYSSPAYLGGMNGGRDVALDGANNVWVENAYSQTGTASDTTNYGVSELATSTTGTTTTFTALSPAPTSTPALASCSASTGCATGGGFYKTAMSPGKAIVIDPSGNVWVPAYGVSSSSTSPGISIESIVGAAVPVVTPISVGIKNSTLASKP